MGDCGLPLFPGRHQKGRRDYRTTHVPGVVYAHLDEHLSGPVISGQTGRHPLPDVRTFARTLSAWGIGDGTQVVVYDEGAGVWAGRLWWMLRWLGHEAVAVLDGDWRAWLAEGRPTRSGDEVRAARPFTRARSRTCWPPRRRLPAGWATPASPCSTCGRPSAIGARWSCIDPVAGHIPGARSIPYTLNTEPDGHFLPPEELRARYEARLDGKSAEESIFYCGSGVSAVHGLLALRHAGLGNGRLYVGSWSEWIADGTWPIETGEGRG